MSVITKLANFKGFITFNRRNFLLDSVYLNVLHKKFKINNITSIAMVFLEGVRPKVQPKLSNFPIPFKAY